MPGYERGGRYVVVHLPEYELVDLSSSVVLDSVDSTIVFLYVGRCREVKCQR